MFDERTQDSGNVSYGVFAGAQRLFVKTAGIPNDPKAFLSHRRRVALLRNAVSFRRCVEHHSLPKLLNVIESPHGPMLVYEWVPGELIGVERSQRTNPTSPFQRFRALPTARLLGALDVVFDFHRRVAELGWVAVDFYDGAMIYDFRDQSLHLIDLDLYRDQPFTNDMGRMFGSTRFMAPEEFERGARIDEVTNVFAMGRVMAVFLSDGALDLTPFRGGKPLYDVMVQACRPERNERFPSMKAFHAAWLTARGDQIVDK
ncbi:MAG TPA: serine/threonine protein kinase [Blastocatellia bacterium]|nr:serine/threonine protein kinase [Blastocatellia bacterium]